MKLLLAAALSAATLIASGSQAHAKTLDDFLRENGMIRVPTTLQNKVLPGTILVVKYRRNAFGQYKFVGMSAYRTRIDVDEPTFHGGVATGEITDNNAFQVGGGAEVALGALTPSLQLSNTHDVTYAGTDFASSEWDTGDVEDLLKNSKLTRDIIKEYEVAGANPPNLAREYQVFIVESVFAASSVHLTNTSATKLVLKNNAPTADCTARADPLAQPAGGGSPAPPASPGGVGAEGAGAKPPAVPADPKSSANAVPLYPAHAELCFAGNHSYVLNHTPPVPLGMRLMEVRYAGGVPDVDVANPSDLKDIK